MKIVDLAGMEFLKSWHESPGGFEGFEQTLKRLTDISMAWELLGRKLPCNGDREKYLLMLLLADAVIAVGEQLRRSCENFKENCTKSDGSASDIPF